MEPTMLDLDVTIGKVTTILDELDIPFAITGGLAVIVYGDPRTTKDIDLVLQIDPWDWRKTRILPINSMKDFISALRGASKPLKINPCSRPSTGKIC